MQGLVVFLMAAEVVICKPIKTANNGHITEVSRDEH